MRKYYSQRNGKHKSALNIGGLRTIFAISFKDFRARHYFDQAFGLDCTDGFIEGTAGGDVGGYVFKKLRKEDLWPIDEKLHTYSREDVFDMVEFLFDHVSKPIEDSESSYHSWNDCGMHYKNFDKIAGQTEFMNEVNQFLNDFMDGYELSAKGEVLTLSEPEFKPLLDAAVPTDDKDNIASKMNAAIIKFRRYGSTLDDRADAVRSLADCLEFLKPKLGTVLNTKDESDLFNIANNFGIRHHNAKQQTNYDKNIWLSWMFYFYLATLHACVRFINKKNK